METNEPIDTLLTTANLVSNLDTRKRQVEELEKLVKLHEKLDEVRQREIALLLRSVKLLEAKVAYLEEKDAERLRAIALLNDANARVTDQLQTKTRELNSLIKANA